MSNGHQWNPSISKARAARPFSPTVPAYTASARRPASAGVALVLRQLRPIRHIAGRALGTQQEASDRCATPVGPKFDAICTARGTQRSQSHAASNQRPAGGATPRQYFRRSTSHTTSHLQTDNVQHPNNTRNCSPRKDMNNINLGDGTRQQARSRSNGPSTVRQLLNRFPIPRPFPSTDELPSDNQQASDSCQGEQCEELTKPQSNAQPNVQSLDRDENAVDITSEQTKLAPELPLQSQRPHSGAQLQTPPTKPQLPRAALQAWAADAVHKDHTRARCNFNSKHSS